jgi:hypothetical protein
MKYTIRFVAVVALSTLAVLIAIPTASAGTLDVPTLSGGTPLPPPDVGDPNPKPPICGWTPRGYRCSVKGTPAPLIKRPPYRW